MKMRWLLIVAFLIVPMDALSLSIGDVAPDFTLRDTMGGEVRLRDLRGRIVFINFWASWCPPCKKELPALDGLKKRNPDLVVLAINIDKRRSTMDAFLRKHPLNHLTILLDNEGKVVSSYGVRAMPTSYIIDGDGKVRFVHYGFDEKKDPLLWEDEINEILNGGRR